MRQWKKNVNKTISRNSNKQMKERKNYSSNNKNSFNKKSVNNKNENSKEKEFV